MGHGLRIWALSKQVRLAAMALALGLATAVPGRSLAGEPAGKERIGQRVVPKHRDFTLRATEDGPERAAKMAIYRVDEVKGGSLRLTPAGGPGGWGDAVQVVPVDEAVEFFSDVISKSPRDPHNYAMRAMVLLFEREDPVHALADCDGAIRLDPQYAFARGVRGAVRAATQDLDSAIADFTEVIRLKPGEPDAYRDRGVARLSNRDFDGAVADFNQAIRLDPKNSATLVCRATAWLSRNRSTRRWPTSTRPFASTRRTSMPISSGVRCGASRGNTTRRSPTSPRSSSSIPRRPWRTRGAVQGGGTRRNTIARSPTTPRPSVSNQGTQGPTSPAASPGATSGRTTRPSPTSITPSGLIPKTPTPTAFAATPGPTRKSSTGRSSILPGPRARPEKRLGLCQPRYRPCRKAAIRQGGRRSRPGPPRRSQQSRRAQRLRLVPGDLPGREVSRRRPGQNGRDQGLRGDRVASTRLARHPRRRRRRGRRLQLRGEVAGQGDRARDRPEGKGRVRCAARALQGQESLSRDEALMAMKPAITRT